MKLLLVIDIADDIADDYGDFTVDYDLRGTPKDNQQVIESIKYVEDYPLKPLNDKALKIGNKDFVIYQREYLMANLDREIRLWKSAKEFEEKQNEQ